ncbi:MAG: Formate dehydrogenase-like protein cytochrome b subunit [Chlorobi bacterium OLB5]|nr:MAG: Formate dehydrogenase-like protein cytochrome b subunit [Chlorobi bacterium OLB5]
MEVKGKKISLYVNPEGYKKSVHNVAECEDCHENYNPDELPHSKNPVEVNCISCHKESKDIETNVHAKVKCYDCHTKHDVKPAKEFAKEQTKTCLSCHKNQNIQHYSQSIHAKNNVTCESCHGGGHKVKNISKGEIALTCGKCHGDHEKNFRNSIHMTVMKEGNKNAPTCTDCHGSHKIIRGKISVESESCLKCHLDETKFPGDEKGSARFVAHYKTSIHAAVEKEGLLEAAGCVDCHGNHMVQEPDNPKASTNRARLMETCGKCHKETVEHFKKSKHGQELAKGNDKAPTCTDCHGEHDIQSTLLSNDFSKINLTDKCLSCHKDGKIPHKNFKGEEELITGYEKSVHYTALKDGNFDAPTCYQCHGAHEMESADNPASLIHKKNIAKTCGQSGCHTQQLGEFTGSIHETGVNKDNKDAPTCNNCHGNHGIVTKNIDNKLEKAKDLVNLCSNCHASVELIERNELPTLVAETYNESFHGLAIRGGGKEAANCESCHSHHNVRPSTDSLSTISKNNLPKTCGNCHPGATEVLFTKKIHITNPEEDSPATFWITRIYMFMIFGLISFMLMHNILDLRRKLQHRKLLKKTGNSSGKNESK